MKRKRPALLSLVLAVPVFFPGVGAASAQDMDHHLGQTVPSTQLKITGLDGKSITVGPEEFAALPHKTVSVFNSHSKINEKYSGVPLTNLLGKVGVPLGEQVK